MSNSNWKPERSLTECHEIITGPGQFHELEQAIIDGRVYRVYKNLWPSIRAWWLSSVSENTDIHNQDYIVFEDTRLTYGQADELVQRAASVLREVYGVRKGDRVGIAMRNFPEWIISFFAAGILGALPTAFNAWLPLPAFEHCINLTSPKLLILDAERLDLLSSRLPSLPPALLVQTTSSKYTTGTRVKEWSKVLSSYSGSTKAWQKEPEAQPDDNATVFFTSGTTGLPKGVLSTQRGFLSNTFTALAGARRRELRLGNDLPPPVGQAPPPESRNPQSALIAVPLFHVTGCTSQLMSGTTVGAKIVLMRKWDKEHAAKLIREESITSAIGVPSIVYDLFESSAVGSTVIEGVGTGGAPAADNLPGEVIKKFPNALVQQGYGMSEMNSLATSVVGEDYLARPSSTGLPPPIVDLLVVDPNTNEVLPPGKAGELWIRGPNAMRGYYNNPKATAEAITRDGWFKTGDLATLDEDGFLYIKDRIKDIIIRGGENIASATVEKAIFADERILDCAVVGIPDRRLGELVAAVAVPRMEWTDKITEKDVLENIKGRLPSFAIPSMIIIGTKSLGERLSEALPEFAGLTPFPERNPAGKVLKKDLRKSVAKEWERRKKVKARL